MLILSILFTLFQLAFAVFFFYLTIAFITGAPFVPSTNKAAKSMIALANIKKGQTVYDLGSGDGRLLFLAAERGAKIAIGYEINPFLVLFTSMKALFSPYKKSVHVVARSFWGAPIENADVVFVYLLPWRMKQLEKKLAGELKKGTVVVSNSFIFPNWKILRSDPANHVYAFRIN